MAAENQAGQVEFDQLTRGVRQLTAYLQTARNRATEAELRGRQLEKQLDQLAPREMGDDPDGELLVRSVARLESAALEGGYD